MAGSQWMSRDELCAYLGITINGMLLLRRDRLITPDCAACGRYRYLRADIERDAVDLVRHLVNKYPQDLDDILLTGNHVAIKENIVL